MEACDREFNPFRCTDLYTQQLLAARHTAGFHKHPLAHLKFNQYLLVRHKLTVRPVYDLQKSSYCKTSAC